MPKHEPEVIAARLSPRSLHVGLVARCPVCSHPMRTAPDQTLSCEGCGVNVFLHEDLPLIGGHGQTGGTDAVS
jgi:hypothetical protein